MPPPPLSPKPPRAAMVGRRVRRGGDWQRGDEDGGAGREGTVAAVHGTDGWLSVKWDAGGSGAYRWGAGGCFDLEPVPAAAGAPAGDTPWDKMVGVRVRRGRDWKWGEQDGGAGKEGCVVALDKDPGWVAVRWDAGRSNIYRWGAQGRWDLIVTAARPSCEQMVGLRVRRGKDWKWGDQDGGRAGKVTEAKQGSGVVSVRWDYGQENNYRWGAEGCYDLVVCADPEVEEADGLELLWTSLGVLHDSLESKYQGELPPTRPKDLEGFYNVLFRYERTIKGGAQNGTWLSGGRRDTWEKEMRGPSSSLEHAASCLLAVEQHIRSSCQLEGWMEKRKPWVLALMRAGGKELDYPDRGAQGSAAAGSDDDLAIVWKALRVMHDNLQSKHLGDVSLNKPSNLEGFRDVLRTYERAIKSEAQQDSWLSGGRREHWKRELAASPFDLGRAATCLLAVEQHIRSRCQVEGWMEKRELWVQALTAVGGKQLDYPAAATQTPAADAAVPADVLVALFFYSCREGDAGAVEGLLTRQAGLDVNAKDDDGWTGLHHACRKGHEGVVRLLLADPRVDRNAKNPRELTALHIACAVGHSAVVGLLVADPKVDVNAKIKGAYTAFHFACSNGHLAVAQVLLDNRRVDFDTVLSDGQTGIDIARSQGHHDIVRAIEAARSRRAAWQTAEQLFKDLDMAQPGKLAPAVPGRPRSRAQSSASDVTIVGGGGDAKPAPARSKTSYWVDEADVAYERSACLGKGGFGAVYRGKYLGLTDVAVKVALDSYSTDEANALLEAEVKVWADLPAHENVVPLLGYRTAPTLLITKLYHGGSMKSFLAGRNWEPALALHLLAEAAVGVTFLHSKGVIHSDLKAENVLVEDGGSRPVAKIADFGLAKVRTRIEDSRGGKAYQYHGLAGATVRYAPPEFFDDEPLRKPSDVWTFGMMCYQVLSRGKDPYDQLSSASAIMKAIFKGERPSRPAGVPDAVWNVVLSCWAEDPNGRPTMASVAMAFKRAIDQPAAPMKAVWAEEGDVQIFRDRLLGRGGFGEVFRGRFRGADVAVKLLHASLDEQDAKAMFEAELKMWIDVPRHDNLVHLLAYRTAPTFLVTELCNGGSLKSFLAAKGWPKPLSIRMLAHAATGIALLHSLGIVHSDLKADNVLVALDASGNPVGRIADFGISKIRTRIEDSHGNKEYQYRGLQGATVRFAPPEFFDHAPMGRQADVWTFGMMCYQVLSGGHDPYSDLTSPAAVMKAIFGGKRPACPGGVSSGVWALVESCWAEEPADRPVMADIARELVRLSAA